MIKTFILGYVCSSVKHKIVSDREIMEFAVSCAQGQMYWNEGSETAILMRVVVRGQELVDFCRINLTYGMQIVIDGELRQLNDQWYVSPLDIRLPGLRSREVVFTAHAEAIHTMMKNPIFPKVTK